MWEEPFTAREVDELVDANRNNQILLVSNEVLYVIEKYVGSAIGKMQ